jgi:hypothetical protein
VAKKNPSVSRIEILFIKLFKLENYLSKVILFN